METKNENDLLEMMKTFKDKHLPKYRLWEYFVINVNAAERQLEEYIEKSIMDDLLSASQRILIKSLKEAEIFDDKWTDFLIK